MKKLMIAAAAAAMIGGAYADSVCAEPGGVTPPDTSCKPQAWVYQWQFKGKTGTGALIKGETIKGGVVDNGSCAESGRNPDVVTCGEVVRVPGSLAIVAYSYICDKECYDLDSALITPHASQYYGTKPLKSQLYTDSFVQSIDVAHVIGKKANQYELAGTVAFNFTDIGQKYTLVFAGFGSYDAKNRRMNSVSGNFAGLQDVPRYAKTFTCNGVTTRCPVADWYDCCTLGYAGLPAEYSVAYGSWSVKYNSSATKKLMANRDYRGK